MKRLLLLLTLLLIAPALTTAQDDTGWPVIERCVGEPTTPPEGWTFDGTILLRGYAGIHGVNAAWETPRVLTFIEPAPYNYASVDGVLSPDLKWYARTIAESIHGGLWVYINVKKIIVYSTVNLNEKYEFPWENAYFGYVRDLRWRDNEHLIYESFLEGKELDLSYRVSENTVLINRLTGETERWPGKIDPLYRSLYLSPAPDWTRAVMKDPSDDTTWVLVDVMTGEKIRDLPLNRSATIQWTPDSQHFAVISSDLWLFDRTGEIIDKIFSFPNIEGVSYPTIQWSFDSRYFGFRVGDSPTPPIKFTYYIADTVKRQIINTCLDSLGEWSSFSHQLADIKAHGEYFPVMIFDLDTWKRYTVAYHHRGGVIGWRAD